MTSAQGGGVTVTIGDPAVAEAAAPVLADASAHDVAARLAARDATLWGEAAEPEASIRLGWVDLVATSRALLPEIARVRDEVARDGLDHVVLAGMGGSSLAPEVITRSAGAALTVLDTTDPHQLRRALTDRLDRTVVVVSSKSGGTIETDSHRRAYEQAFREAGLTEDQVAARFVIVTDPGSPLEAAAVEAGYRAVFRADPEVGGRFSALTAFGLVPSALAGVDVAALLDAAEAVGPPLTQDHGVPLAGSVTQDHGVPLAGSVTQDHGVPLAGSVTQGQPSTNPGLLLGAALGGAALAGRDKLVLADADPGLVGFGDWAEQLVAESTGKDGRGILPVAVEGPGAPGFAGAGPDALATSTGPAAGAAVTVTGPLGAQFLVWEYATAVAGRALGINPFDQPNVAESKDNTARLLQTLEAEGSLPAGEPLFVGGPVEVYGDEKLVNGADSLAGALAALLGAVPDRGYLAVMAYLDRIGDARAAELRPRLATALRDRQVTYGWGPRFLHSTGQYHKGGPQLGAFLQITGAVTHDVPVPGRPYSFGQLHLAQALGDLGALAGRGRPVLRLHLLDRAAGVAALLDAASSLRLR